MLTLQPSLLPHKTKYQPNIHTIKVTKRVIYPSNIENIALNLKCKMFADAQCLLTCNYIYVESTVLENKADFVDPILGSKQWDSLLLSILNTAQIQRRSRIIKNKYD